MTSLRTTIFPFCSGLALTFFVHTATAAGPTPGTAYYVLTDYPVQTANESDFRTEYWGRSVGNATDSCPECKVSLTSTKDASGDFARLTYSLPKTGKGAGFAKAGILVPLDNIWSSSNDLRMSSRLMFKARTSSTYPMGVNLKVSVESPAFPFQSAGYTRNRSVGVAKDWTWYSIDYREFSYASWMKNDALMATKNVVISGGFPADTSVLRSVTLNPRAVAGKLLIIDSSTSAEYDNDSINALKNVQALRFEIDPIYGTGGFELDWEYLAASQGVTLDIDSITLVGIHGEGDDIFRGGNKCTGTPFVLDDFNMADPAKVAGGVARNYANGYWYAVSDTDSKAMPPSDSAVGRSWIDPSNPGDPKSRWGIDSTAEHPLAEMLVVLDKGSARAHPWAGWAEMGTTIPTSSKMSKGVDFAGVDAFEFKILAGGTDPFHLKFDKSRLGGVEFRVGVEGNPDSESYAVKIPFTMVDPNANSGDLVSVCIDRTSLRRPDGVRALTENVAPTEIIAKLAWRLAIVDPKESKADTSLLQIGGVRLYGGCALMGGCDPVKAREGASRQISATYHDGLQLTYSLPGAARIEVLRMDGSLVASLAGAASGRNLSIPVKLTRGTYLVVVRGGGQVRSVTLPVLGR